MRRLYLALAFVAAFGLSGPALVGATGGGSTVFYSVNLATGQLSPVGAVGDPATVIGLAVLDAGGTTFVYAATADNRLLQFFAHDPGTIISKQAISGLPRGESLVGIDIRPATNFIYGLGASGTLYVIDAPTATASAVGAPISPGLESATLGFDFNPTVDRIRVDVETGQNLRLNPDTGQIGADAATGLPTIDDRIAYAAGDPLAGAQAAPVGAGYTNNFAGATSTVLYVIDAAQDVLTIQDPPNDGVLNTVGSLGVDAGAFVQFDIGSSGAAYATIS